VSKGIALRTSRNGALREGTVAGSDDERELRKMMEDMTVESKLPAREQRLHRLDRIIVRRPRLFREAARKALLGESLSEDEFAQGLLAGRVDRRARNGVVCHSAAGMGGVDQVSRGDGSPAQFETVHLAWGVKLRRGK
jgi:hypothetical protein